MSPSPGEMPDLESMLASGGSRTPGRGEPEPESRPEPDRYFVTGILVLAAVLGFFAIRSHWVPNKWLFGDGAFYMNVARGVLENGSLRQEAMHPHSWYDRDLGWNRDVDAAWSNIALGRNGEWWPKHPFLMPLVALPFIWAFGSIGSLVFQFLMCLAMGLLTFRVASRVASRPAALLATGAFLASPWIADRVWGFNNDVFYTVLILWAFDAALTKKALLAGALLGIGVFAKATNVLYGPALLALFLFRKDWKGAFRFCAAAAVPAVVYLGLNWYLYASPFNTGYDRILVREGGQLGMHSHRADFHFSGILPGMRRVLFGGEGFLGKFPLFFAGAAGLLLLAVKRWREALVFAWCMVVPIAFHAPYTWYRLEFNLPQIALAIAPLAALLPPLSPPFEGEDRPGRVRWGRILPILAVFLLLISGGVRRLLEPRHDYFWRELPRAAVFLGDVPCDYYNNQMERWECSHFDDDWAMTGRPLNEKLTFAGKREEMLLMHPHTSGKERRLEYAKVPMGKSLEVRYGLADSAKGDAVVQFKVLVDGQPLFEQEVRDHKLETRQLDTSAFAGKEATVTFAVTSPSPGWCHFMLNGGPRD